MMQRIFDKWVNPTTLLAAVSALFFIVNWYFNTNARFEALQSEFNKQIADIEIHHKGALAGLTTSVTVMEQRVDGLDSDTKRRLDRIEAKLDRLIDDRARP